jgi:hypothetical protein
MGVKVCAVCLGVARPGNRELVSERGGMGADGEGEIGKEGDGV